MQDNAKLHKTHIQFCYTKSPMATPHLQGEISVNQLQTCTSDELKQKSASMQSTRM